MKIMLDTNIIFSALYGGKVARPLVKYISDHPKFQLFLPIYAIGELRESIEEKYPEKTPEINGFLANLNYTPIEIPKNTKLTKFNIRDADDIPILQAATLKKVDILITGDKDFETVTLKKIKIMTIADFLQTYVKEQLQ